MFGLIIGGTLGGVMLYGGMLSYGYNPILSIIVTAVAVFLVIFSGSKLIATTNKKGNKKNE